MEPWEHVKAVVTVRLAEPGPWPLSLSQIEALLVIGGLVTAAAIKGMRVLYRAGKTYESVAGKGGVADRIDDLERRMQEQKVTTGMILDQHREIMQQQSEITRNLARLSEQFAEVFETHIEVRKPNHE